MWESRSADFELQVGDVDLTGQSFRRLAWKCCKALGPTEETIWFDLMGNTKAMQDQVTSRYISFAKEMIFTPTKLFRSPDGPSKNVGASTIL